MTQNDAFQGYVCVCMEKNGWRKNSTQGYTFSQQRLQGNYRHLFICDPELRYRSHLPIIRMRNRDQYRMFIKGVSGLALEESKMHTFSRI